MESGEFKEPSQLTEAIHCAFPRWGGVGECGKDISPEQAGIDGTGLTDNQVAIGNRGCCQRCCQLTDISASD